jgi:hypothetical protein
MELLEGMETGFGYGNISWFPHRQKTLGEIIEKQKPKNLIEIGFNEGHSLMLICEKILELKQKGFYSEPVRIFVFDICEKEQTISNFIIMEEHYKKEEIYLNLIPGNSIETIPQFFNYNQIMFDFIEIDGNHTYDFARQDLLNTYSAVKEGGVLYVDDYKSSKVPIPDVDRAVDEFNWVGWNTYYTDGAFWAEKQITKMENNEQVNHPNHYGGETNPYEAIKVIDAWDLGFSLGNTVKYISRAGKKNKEKELEDLKKALWYLEHHIETLEKK